MQTEQSATRRRYAGFDLNRKDAPAWPPGPLPKLEGKEALSAARRLYRLAMKCPFKGKLVLTSGNRRTWTHSGELRVNPDQGWKEMVHDLSHLCHRRLYPNETGHGWHHAKVEAAMIRHVVESGWLEGKLRRPVKPKPPAAETRYERTVEAIRRWETKLKRAETALKKLRKRRRYYEQKRAA